MRSSCAFIDASEVSTQLADHAAEVATFLIGQPNRTLSSARELRFGNKGALVVVTKGDKAGQWFDHSANTGGDMLELIRQHRGCNLADAIQWGLAWLGQPHDQRYVVAPRQEKTAQTDDDSNHRIARALQIWSEAIDPADTPVEHYLNSRGLYLSDLGGRVIRYHARVGFSIKSSNNETIVAHFPAMVALLRDLRTDEPCGIHLSALEPDGSGKCKHPGFAGNPRRMRGRAQAAAIKFDAEENVGTGLGIGEGIETTLSVRQSGWRPCWALGSASAIANFQVLTGVDALTIFADHDAPNGNGRQPGLEAAATCAQRWIAAGCEVREFRPKQTGSDFNDVRRAG